MRHKFDVEVARECGVNAAVVFEYIAFWVSANARASRNKKDGEFWVYGTTKAMADQFGYLSEKQVRTSLSKLKAADYIKTNRFNKHGYDKTTWYGLTEKGQKLAPLLALASAQKGGPIPNNKKLITERKMDYAASPFDF